MDAFRVHELSLPPENGRPASHLTDEEYETWRRRKDNMPPERTSRHGLLPRRIAGSLPRVLSTRILSSEGWCGVARRAESILELLRAPADSTGHRRHNALYAAGLYGNNREIPSDLHDGSNANGHLASPIGTPNANQRSWVDDAPWWLPLAAHAVWREAFTEEEGWW